MKFEALKREQTQAAKAAQAVSIFQRARKGRKYSYALGSARNASTLLVAKRPDGGIDHEAVLDKLHPHRSRLDFN